MYGCRIIAKLTPRLNYNFLFAAFANLLVVLIDWKVFNDPGLRYKHRDGLVSFPSTCREFLATSTRSWSAPSPTRSARNWRQIATWTKNSANLWQSSCYRILIRHRFMSWIMVMCRVVQFVLTINEFRNTNSPCHSFPACSAGRTTTMWSTSSTTFSARSTGWLRTRQPCHLWVLIYFSYICFCNDLHLSVSHGLWKSQFVFWKVSIFPIWDRYKIVFALLTVWQPERLVAVLDAGRRAERWQNDCHQERPRLPGGKALRHQTRWKNCAGRRGEIFWRM